jgi:hypothetical protein
MGGVARWRVGRVDVEDDVAGDGIWLHVSHTLALNVLLLDAS